MDCIVMLKQPRVPSQAARQCHYLSNQCAYGGRSTSRASITMRPGGQGWPHPLYSPFNTHLGRLISETGVSQLKLAGPSRCDHLAPCRIGPVDSMERWKEWRMTAMATSNWALACWLASLITQKGGQTSFLIGGTRAVEWKCR